MRLIFGFSSRVQSHLTDTVLDSDSLWPPQETNLTSEKEIDPPMEKVTTKTSVYC